MDGWIHGWTNGPMDKVTYSAAQGGNIVKLEICKILGKKV